MKFVPPPPQLPGTPRIKRPPVQLAGSLAQLAAAAPSTLDVSGQLQELLATPPGHSSPTNPADAAKDFAAILFGYMFSEMRPHESEDGLLGGGDSEMFMSFFDQAIGKDMASAQGDQLVKALVQELTPQAPAKPQPKGR